MKYIIWFSSFEWFLIERIFVDSVKAEVTKYLPGSAIMVTPLFRGNHSLRASFTRPVI